MSWKSTPFEFGEAHEILDAIDRLADHYDVELPGLRPIAEVIREQVEEVEEDRWKSKPVPPGEPGPRGEPGPVGFAGPVSPAFLPGGIMHHSSIGLTSGEKEKLTKDVEEQLKKIRATAESVPEPMYISWDPTELELKPDQKPKRGGKQDQKPKRGGWLRRKTEDK